MIINFTKKCGRGGQTVLLILLLILFQLDGGVRISFCQVSPVITPVDSKNRLGTDSEEKVLVINGPCTNMGFEENTFNGWTGNIQKRSTNPAGPIVPGPVQQGFLQHCIMTSGMSDPLVPSLPVVPPGKNYAIRVGNTATGGHMVKLRQTFMVNPDSSNMIFSYSYAVILEDPSSDTTGHSGLNRPHFIAKLFDKNGNEISCAAYTVIVASGLAGFAHACVDEATGTTSNTNTGCPSNATGQDGSIINTPISTTIKTGSCGVIPQSFNPGMRDIYFKSWSTVAIPLNAYVGQNVTIEFTTADCTPGGHRGYAYVSSSCMPLKIVAPSAICPGISRDTIKGPDGFSSYQWTGPVGGISGPSNTQSIVAIKGGTYKATLTPYSDVPCPLVINYVVKEDCPKYSYKDTLCENVRGTGTAANINLNDYNAMLTAPTANSSIKSWHTAKPATAGNRIQNITNFSASDNQKIYAVIAYPSLGGDTSDLTFKINKLPQINFPDQQPVCIGSGAFQIKGITPGNGVFTGANVNSSGTFTPADAGSFTITYTVTSAAGCTDSLKKPIVVKLQPTVDAGADQQLCSNTPSFVLNGQATNTTSVLWKGGKGTFVSANNVLNVTYTPDQSEITVGKVTLTLLNTDSLICPAAKDQLTLTFEKIPAVDAGEDQNFCIKNPQAKLNATSTNAKGVTWSGGAGTFSSTTSLTPTYTPAATEINSVPVTLKLVTTGSVLCNAATDEVQLTFRPMPEVNAGPDQTVCADAPNVVLNGTILVNGFGATWSNGQGNFVSGKTVLNTAYNPLNTEIASQKVDLILTSTNNGSCPPAVDSMRITIIPLPVIELGSDIVNCVGASGNLSVASLPGVSYSWLKDNIAQASSGNTLPYQMVNQVNNYKVTAKDTHGCTYSDSIKLSGIPVPLISVKDTSVCEGSPAKLIAVSSNISNALLLKPVYDWKKENVDLNSHDSVITASSAGVYTVKISVGKCSNEASATVYYRPFPQPDLPDQITFCPDSALNVELDAGPGTKYLWKPTSETSQKIRPVASGTYKVTVTNQFSCSTDDATEIIEICPPRLFISNSFSPNKDGNNDFYYVYGAHFTNFKMLIFNRWGEVIFETTDRYKVWDGYYNGEQMTIGVYPWIITYEGDTKKYKGPYKMVGSVTVVR